MRYRQSEPSVPNEMKIEHESTSSPKSTPLFASVPEAKKSKKTTKNKQKKLLHIAKFAKVPVEELMKEFQNESKNPEIVKKEPVSSLSFLPAPQHSPTNASEEKTVAVDEEEDPFSKSNGVIPLNPFLSDLESIQAERKKEEVDTPFIYTTVAREPRLESVKEFSPLPSTDTNEVAQYGYGGNFSQSQYEAFIRRSGMLATANAATSSSANLLVGVKYFIDIQGEDAKYYDKQTKRALEEGSIMELNQNDLHDHNDQPGSEYWEKKRVCVCFDVHEQKRQVVAEEFGKYAHIAPTQVQQTRNQITSLAAEAIVALAEQDERRAQMRKTKREIRAKYGW